MEYLAEAADDGCDDEDPDDAPEGRGLDGDTEGLVERGVFILCADGHRVVTGHGVLRRGDVHDDVLLLAGREGVDRALGELDGPAGRQGGVDTSLIKWMETDGIGRVCRNGLNFTERGFGIRGAVGCSDRANTAISKAKPEDFDFDYIFGELGARWLHTGGIYAALSEQSCETVLAAIKAAKKYGTIVSYDLNYRPSMWSAIGGIEKAQEVNKEIAKYVDVMIGNEEDFTACLGFEIEGNDANLKELNLDGYKKMINEAAKTYPNFKAVATTLREVKTATVNDWSAICWADGEIFKAKDYKGLEIMDRVGGGDSFASGLIYGLMTTENAELAVNYGAAHGALAMTTPGDTTMASKKEVEAIMGGAGAEPPCGAPRVQHAEGH